MRYQDIAKLSTRMFKTAPARTWLTIAGMGVGIGAVVTLVALGFGLQKIILDQIVFGDTLLALNVSNPLLKTVELTDATITEFAANQNVLKVAPMAQFPILVSMNGLTGNGYVQGVEPPYYKYTGAVAVAGELHADAKSGEQQDAVVLSRALLKLFDITEPEKAIGKKVQFRILVENPETKEMAEVPIDKEYRVIGVSNEEAFMSAFMPLAELKTHVNVSSYERVQVRVKDGAFLSIVTNDIIQKGFVVTALSKTVDQANKIFQGVQAVLAVFGSIALTVSAIGMFNTMTVTLLERTKEIGIMRTLGASSNDIKILFLSESIIVGTLGGVMGICFGLVIGLTLNGLVSVAAAAFGGKSMMLFYFPIWFILFILGFAAFVGFLTGVFPSMRASKINPLDAIRYG
jgi:ABC-type antimicrobial peptide transport system permease subunit